MSRLLFPPVVISRKPVETSNQRIIVGHALWSWQPWVVLAAFLAAVERPAEPFVLAAFRAAAVRADAVRCEAARRPCFESAARDAVLRGSRLRAFDTARETRGRRRGFRFPWPASYAYSALLRVFALALPFPRLKPQAQIPPCRIE